MSSLDDLLQTSPSDLVADLQVLEGERALIERKETVLRQIIQLLYEQGGPVATELSALGAPIATGSLREQILLILSSKPRGKIWPKEVLPQLVDRGNRDVTIDNVRVTMSRMAESGELRRSNPKVLAFELPTQGNDDPPGGPKR